MPDEHHFQVTHIAHQVLPALHFTALSTSVSLHTILQSLCYRGHHQARTAQGHMACHKAHPAMQPMGRQRLRPSAMTFFNFHTHDTAAHDAIISVSPSCFDPHSGLLYSVGIHPWNTIGDLQQEWDLLETFCHHQQVVAIGETGLDTLRGAPLDIQIEIFKRHIAMAEQIGKPIIVHCVRAWQELITTWRSTAPHHVSLAVHGFRGNAAIAKQLVKEGFYLSFGEHFKAEALAVTPHYRILIENDDSNSDIANIASHVAETLQMPVTDIIAISTANAAKFLNL